LKAAGNAIGTALSVAEVIK